MTLQVDDDYPLVLALIATAAYDQLRARTKLDHAEASELAFSISEQARVTLGGGAHYYIPKGQQWLLSKRDREIWDKFRGNNYQALAQEYDLTEMRIRQIIERCRQAEMKSLQSGLDFGD